MVSHATLLVGRCQDKLSTLTGFLDEGAEHLLDLLELALVVEDARFRCQVVEDHFHLWQML